MKRILWKAGELTLLTIAVCLVFAGLIWGALTLAIHRTRASYPMPPESFYAQEQIIKPGMTLDAIRPLLKGVTHEGGTSFSVYFAMEPVARDRFFTMPILSTYYINLELDGNGHVTKVSTSDG